MAMIPRVRRVNLSLWAYLCLLALLAAAAASWVANIVKLFWIAQATDPNYVMAILRAVGIFVAPLGVILGLL